MRPLASLLALAVISGSLFVDARPAGAQTDGAYAAASSLQQLLDERTRGFPGSGIIAAHITPSGTLIAASGSTGTARSIDRKSLFEIGSVTKTFTATILATMVLDGSVKLDDPIAKYLPAAVHVPTRNGKAITLLDLATQRSGLPRLPTNLKHLEAADPYATYSVDDMYAFLSSYELTRDPGESFEYSNYGIALLGQVLASAAHTTYAELLRVRVLTPLHMDDTTLEITPLQRARFAAGRDDTGALSPPWSFAAVAPAGGLHSSIDDLLKFAACNLGHGPLAVACLYAQQPRSDIPGNRIGLVWFTDNVRHIVHHGGDTAGYHAAIAIAPDHSSATIVLSAGGMSLEDIALHALDATVPVAIVPPPFPVDAVTLGAYVGSYANADTGLQFHISTSDGVLSGRLTGQSPLRLTATARDAFAVRSVGAVLHFARDGSGMPVAVVLLQSGRTHVFVRPGKTAPPDAVSSLYPPTTTLDLATLQSYRGTYTSSIGAFYVTLENMQLLVRLEGQSANPVFATARDAFFYKAVDAQIAFSRDAGGKVYSLTLLQNGLSIVATRQ